MDSATAAGILVAIPVFGLLVLTEVLISKRLHRDYYTQPLDALASFTSGLWNLIIVGTGLVFTVVGYEVMVDRLQVVNLGSTLFAAVVAFVLLDFGNYWLHRAAHTYNFLWQTHLVHHAGEQFNIASSVRQGGTPFSLRFLVLLPVAMLGVSAPVVFLIGGIQLVGVAWYHTRFFNEMGILGKVFVTPGFHRVHHGMNRVYLDRNFSALLSIWDHLFGTYQAELPDEPVVVGLTRPPRTFNPLRLDYYHWWQMLQDSLHAHSARDKVRVWTSRTNWRPPDVAAVDPLVEVKGEDVHVYERYEPYADRLATSWSFLEVTMQTILVAAMFWAIYAGLLSWTAMVACAGFLLMSIVTYTTAMDARPHTLWATLRLAVAAGLVGVLLAGGSTVVVTLLAALVLAFFAGAVVTSRVAKRVPAPAPAIVPVACTLAAPAT